MSLGGLSFEYPESATEVGEPAELDLLSDVGDAYLGKIPFETVSDLRVAPDKALDTGSRRRCSVKFTALTPKQQARLKTFVAGAAVDPRAVSFC